MSDYHKYNTTRLSTVNTGCFQTTFEQILTSRGSFYLVPFQNLYAIGIF